MLKVQLDEAHELVECSVVDMSAEVTRLTYEDMLPYLNPHCNDSPNPSHVNITQS